MKNEDLKIYEHIRDGGAGFCRYGRGLISVSGGEAVKFLDGMITNDMKTLADGGQMLAAFPNAQGRLLALVRVLWQGERFLFDTDDATREILFNNLFRFTYAGDFFVEDLTDNYRYVEIFGQGEAHSSADNIVFSSKPTQGHFVPTESAEEFCNELVSEGAAEIDEDVYETLRIESGIPKFGVDMDETTIVPELGLDGLISYNKGCYIGQEIIARIHFRGHVAKQLTGLMSEPGAVATGLLPGSELHTPDGKNAGRITSAAFSPKLGKMIALAYVRYDHLEPGTELSAGQTSAFVQSLPFL